MQWELRKVIQALSIIFSLTISQFSAWGGLPSSSPGEWGEWQEVKTLYDAKKFQQALEELRAHPADGAAYHYNMGIMYYRVGQLGASLAHLEKANRLFPHEADIQYNLSIVRNALGKSIGAENLDPASTWMEKIADHLSLDEIRTALGALTLLVILLWIRAYWTTRNLKHALLTPSGLIALIGVLFSAGVYQIERRANSYPPAIALEKQTIRSGPGQNYYELAQAPEGAKLRLLGPSASAESTTTPEVWRQVRFAQDGVGWVKDSSLLAL